MKLARSYRHSSSVFDPRTCSSGVRPGAARTAGRTERQTCREEKKAQPEKPAKQEEKETRSRRRDARVRRRKSLAQQQRTRKPEEKKRRQQQAQAGEKTHSSASRRPHSRRPLQGQLWTANTRFVSARAITTITASNTAAIGSDSSARGPATGSTRKTFM